MAGQRAQRDGGKPAPQDGKQPLDPGPRRAPAPGQRQRDAERSRQALLAAARDEFAERGFAGARVAGIARRAGVNKQLINYYFGSKEGLYLELQRARLQREEESAQPDLPLGELLARYLADTLRDPRALRLLLWRGLADEGAPHGDGSREPALDQLAQQAAGQLADDLDPAAVLLAGMGMIAAPIAMPQVARELFGMDPSSGEFFDRYADQLRRIVARLAGPPPPGLTPG